MLIISYILLLLLVFEDLPISTLLGFILFSLFWKVLVEIY